jgi:biotin carboxyl carrier protein
MKYFITVEDETFEIEVGREGRVWINRQPYNVDLQSVNGLPQYSLLVDHRSHEAHIEHAEEDECRMLVAGRSYQAYLQRGRSRPGDVTRPSTAGRQGSLPVEVCAPLPGLLVEMCVAEGEQVREKDVVAVLESMKMNLELLAPQDGVIQALPKSAGVEIGQGEVLAIIRPSEYL